MLARYPLVVSSPVGPAAFAQQRARVERIDGAAAARAGHPALGDAVWRDLDAPQTDSALFFADDAAVAHIARSDNFSPRHWAVGYSSTATDDATEIALLEAALQHVAAHGGGRVVLWVLGASDRDERILTRLGFHADRELHEMRVPLPLAQQPKLPTGVTVRSFEPGRDEAAWLEVNNRAFANHEEQGDWIEETLRRRMREPWFDPTVFFLAFDGNGLAGFNWMKIHTNERGERLGEIFVIGVDPRFQSGGLGRALAIIGLDAVAERGITTGSLFVAADNAGAHHLYESLGFTVHRVDRAYETEVVPS
jgi:mycothiol synthase